MDEVVPAGALQVKVAFDRHEQRAAHWAALAHGPLWNRPAVTVPFGLGVGAVLVWLQRTLSHPTLPGAGSIVGSAAVLGLGLVVFIFAVKRFTRRDEAFTRHENSPDLYTLSDEGLEISGADDLVLMSWSNMTRACESRRFFLFMAGKEVQYLPKRALDPAQADLVRSLIARHAPGTKEIPAST